MSTDNNGCRRVNIVRPKNLAVGMLDVGTVAKGFNATVKNAAMIRGNVQGGAMWWGGGESVVRRKILFCHCCLILSCFYHAARLILVI